MTRADLAIDYHNTNLKVEPLANTDTDESESSVVSCHSTDGLTVMMSNAHGGSTQITAEFSKPQTLDSLTRSFLKEGPTKYMVVQTVGTTDEQR